MELIREAEQPLSLNSSINPYTSPGRHRVDVTPEHRPWQPIERFQVFDRAWTIGTAPLVERDALARRSDEALHEMFERHVPEQRIADWLCSSTLQPAL